MMKQIEASTLELSGTSYKIGEQLGRLAATRMPLKKAYCSGMPGFGPAQAQEAARLFDRWCPGLTEELAGFAAALAVPPEKVLYYSMTYLLPRCSHMALSPAVTADGKPLAARNYEFSDTAEDFTLMRTSVSGRYRHLGTGVLFFGRDDGINEHGLVVTMSSCGFPVGALPHMRAPARKGLQFWAVVRALLENCKDVPEALSYLEGMPIAYNLNLIVLDRYGQGALVETLDGLCAVRRMEPGAGPQLLYATNHAILPQLAAREPKAMAHSLRRYEYLGQQLAGQTAVTPAQLKRLLLAPYPDGLCCHDYQEFFGTTKSILFFPADGALELCWGGRAENGWHTYHVAQPLANEVLPVNLTLEKAAPGAYAWVPLAER